MNNIFGKVAVITINYRQLAITCECLESILESDYYPFDIIVVDNGSSSDDYAELTSIYYGRVKILSLEKNIGYVGAINHALTECKSQGYAYYLIMNNDATIDSMAMRNLVEASKAHKDQCIVSGKVYHYDKPQYLQYIGQSVRNEKRLDFPPIVKKGMELDVGQYEHEMEMGMLDDIFWLLPAPILEKVGLYCEYFFLYGEQNDYALRAKRLGFNLIYTPKAKIRHRGSVSTSAGDRNSPKLTYWRTKSYLVLLALHAKKRYLLSYYTKLWFKRIIFGLPLLLHKKIKNKSKEISNYRAILLALICFSHWYVKRKKDDGFNPFD